MIYTKKDEIKNMMVFLDFGKHDHLFMRGISISEEGFPSCNSDGEFFINLYVSRRPMPDPPDRVINFAHAKLVWECKRQFSKLQLRHNNMAIINLLKKYYNLEFIAL